MSEKTPGDLTGRIAMVTGATRNLGEAAVRELARRGAGIVIVTSGPPEKAQPLADECAALSGAPAVAVRADVGDPEQIETAMAQALERVGQIDIAITCAAVRPFAPLLEITLADWDRVIRTNLTSAFVFAKVLLPGMLERGWGRIINISGADGFHGFPNRAHNVTAKAGIHGLTKAIAVEVAGSGVTANTIAPGTFATVREAVNYPTWDEDAEAARVPVKRLGLVSEFAAACAYLSSDESAYMIGQVLHINGGTFIG